MSEYEGLPSSVWHKAWAELYKTFSERLQQDELDLMDSVLSKVVADMQEEIQSFKVDEILRIFPHLATKESVEEVLEAMKASDLYKALEQIRRITSETITYGIANQALAKGGK